MAGASGIEHPVNRALVVDESRAIRIVARRILELNDFQVSEANDAEHAIAIWSQLKPDLILANWYATGARWLFDAIRNHPNRHPTRLVALLVENDPREVETAARAGAHGFLLKPFTRETVALMLEDVGLAAAELIEPPALASDGLILPGVNGGGQPAYRSEFTDEGISRFH